jgi:nicotinamidase-related amidase
MEDFMNELKKVMPIVVGRADLRRKRVGLVVVDPVQGFCDFGALADAASMKPMIDAVDKLGRDLIERRGAAAKVLVFRDAHKADVPEPPYPPHCVIGTGEELVTPRLRWLEAKAKVIDKDCINGFVGAIDVATGKNAFLDWVRALGPGAERGAGRDELDALIVTGDCTDICVLDFVVATLSARNHGLCGQLGDVVVYTPGVATYDLADPAALGLPAFTRHPAAAFHHAALAMMQRRGAVLADQVEV